MQKKKYSWKSNNFLRLKWDEWDKMRWRVLDGCYFNCSVLKTDNKWNQQVVVIIDNNSQKHHHKRIWRQWLLEYVITLRQHSNSFLTKKNLTVVLLFCLAVMPFSQFDPKTKQQMEEQVYLCVLDHNTPLLLQNNHS